LDLLRTTLDPTAAAGASSAAAVAAAAQIALPSERAADAGAQGADALTSVVLSRLAIAEAKQERDSTLLGKLYDLMMGAFNPGASAASSGGGATGGVPAPAEADAGGDLRRITPAALLPDGGASLTNKTIAAQLPGVDAQTRALLAGGVLPDATAKGDNQPHVLLPGHCVNERGKREGGPSSLTLMHHEFGSSSGLCLAPASPMPGGGKVLSDKTLLERMPSVIGYLAASTKTADILERCGFMSAAERVLYDTSFMREMKRSAETFLCSSRTDSWLLFLKLDQDLRYEQFDERRPWDYCHGLIDGGIHNRALAVLHSNPHPPGGSTASAAGAGPGRNPGPNPGPRPRPPRAGAGTRDLDVFATIPAAFRATCCVSFYTSGACNRPMCKFAALGHKCYICGSQAHGTAQCDQAPAGPGQER
jgi:hypothetical protein